MNNNLEKENSILYPRIIRFFYGAGKDGQEKEYEVKIRLNGEQLQNIARTMKEKNLGGPVEIIELNPEIWQYLFERCEDDFAQKYMQSGRIEDYNVCIDFDMPEELVYACQRINCMDSYLDVDFYPQEKDSELIDVVVRYSAEHNGQIVEESLEYGMRKDIAEIMKTVAELKPLGVTDFDFMREVAPKAFDYVYNDVKVWCNNKHLEEWKEVVEVELADFPQGIMG